MCILIYTSLYILVIHEVFIYNIGPQLSFVLLLGISGWIDARSNLSCLLELRSAHVCVLMDGHLLIYMYIILCNTMYIYIWHYYIISQENTFIFFLRQNARSGHMPRVVRLSSLGKKSFQWKKCIEIYQASMYLVVVFICCFHVFSRMLAHEERIFISRQVTQQNIQAQHDPGAQTMPALESAVPRNPTQTQ